MSGRRGGRGKGRGVSRAAHARLRRLVHEALDRAVEGGHGDFVRTEPVSLVVEDLLRCESSLEGKSVEDIYPYAESWRQARTSGKGSPT